MFEYHGWATMIDHDPDEIRWDAADCLSRDAYDRVVALLDDEGLANDFQSVDLTNRNGYMQLRLDGFRNHRQQLVIDAFSQVAALAPMSYGLLYVHDDEHPDYNNQWVVHVMARGKVEPRLDTFLSPHVPVVEDPEP